MGEINRDSSLSVSIVACPEATTRSKTQSINPSDPTLKFFGRTQSIGGTELTTRPACLCQRRGPGLLCPPQVSRRVFICTNELCGSELHGKTASESKYQPPLLWCQSPANHINAYPKVGLNYLTTRDHVRGPGPILDDTYADSPSGLQVETSGPLSPDRILCVRETVW